MIENGQSVLIEVSIFGHFNPTGAVGVPTGAVGDPIGPVGDPTR